MKRTLAILLTLALVISVISLPVSSASADTTMHVIGGWLRLRSGPSFTSATIASYYTGTTVTVMGTSGQWYYVKVSDGQVGYMYSSYLSSGGSVTPSGTSATVISSNGYGVKLRTGPGTGYGVIRVYPVGTVATIISAGTYWDYICINGTYGYMMSQFLTTGGSVDPSGGYLAYVTSQNGLGVRLRTGPGTNYSIMGLYSVGTLVTVLQHGTVWDYIRIGSRTGYMMTQFLTTSGVVNTITAVSISNTKPYTGDVLTATITPSGATAVYSWVDQDGVTLGTGSTYTVTSADVGKYIRVTVVGTGNYNGSATSALTAAVQQRAALETITLDNTEPVVGDKLTATLTPPGATATIYWYRSNGTYLGKGTSYTCTKSDIGYGIAARAVGSGSYTGDIYTAYTDKVVAEKKKTEITDADISNTSPRVGDTLTVNIQPSGAEADVVWYSNGTAIGYGTSYTVQESDLDEKLYAEVTGINDYTGTVTTAATDKVRAKADPGDPTELTGVTISGSTAQGGTLMAAYTPDTAAGVSYSWTMEKADGTVVELSTSESLTLNNAAILGHTVTVTVTGDGTQSTGEKSASIYVPEAGSTAEPINSVTIIGSAEVGETLYVSIDPTDAGSYVTYGWQLSDGTSLGTGSSAVIPAGAEGKTVTVTVTGDGTVYTGAVSDSATVAASAIGSVTITGYSGESTANVYDVLTAYVTGSSTGVTYTWTMTKSSGEAVIGNEQSYTVNQACAAHTLTVTATGDGTHTTGTVTASIEVNTVEIETESNSLMMSALYSFDASAATDTENDTEDTEDTEEEDIPDAPEYTEDTTDTVTDNGNG